MPEGKRNFWTTMPGVISTTRTAKNVSNRILAYKANTQSPAGTSISVSPGAFVLAPGQQATLQVTISAPSAAQG